MPITDRFNHIATGLTSPARSSYSVTPSDSADLPITPREIRAGTGGTIVGWLIDDDDTAAARTFSNIQDGERLPYRFKRIKATGTTASGIIAIY